MQELQRESAYGLLYGHPSVDISAVTLEHGKAADCTVGRGKDGRSLASRERREALGGTDGRVHFQNYSLVNEVPSGWYICIEMERNITSYIYFCTAAFTEKPRMYSLTTVANLR